MISNFLGRNISIPTNSFGAEDIFSLSLFAVCFPTHRRFTGSQYRKLRAQISVSLYLLSDIVNPKMAAREKKGKKKTRFVRNQKVLTGVGLHCGPATSSDQLLPGSDANCSICCHLAAARRELFCDGFPGLTYFVFYSVPFLIGAGFTQYVFVYFVSLNFYISIQKLHSIDTSL